MQNSRRFSSRKLNNREQNSGKRNNRKHGIGTRILALILSVLLFAASGQEAFASQEQTAESGWEESLMDKALTKEQADEIFEFIIQKIADGGLDDEEAVRAAIEEGEEQFQISLTDEEKEKIVQVVEQVNAWGLDTEELAKKAQSLYEEYGTELLEDPKKAAAGAVKNSISSSIKGIGDFFAGIGRGIKNFFQNSIKSFFDNF